VICPGRTSNVNSSTARIRPNCLVRPWTAIGVVWVVVIVFSDKAVATGSDWSDRGDGDAAGRGLAAVCPVERLEAKPPNDTSLDRTTDSEWERGGRGQQMAGERRQHALVALLADQPMGGLVAVQERACSSFGTAQVSEDRSAHQAVSQAVVNAFKYA
jgi:hypothetical protein